MLSSHFLSTVALTLLLSPAHPTLQPCNALLPTLSSIQMPRLLALAWPSILTSLLIPDLEETVEDVTTLSATHSIIAFLLRAAAFRPPFFLLHTNRLKPQTPAAVALFHVLLQMYHSMVLLHNFTPSWSFRSFECIFFFVPSCLLSLLCARCLLQAAFGGILL